MTRMLASVSTLAEAKVVLASGTDIVDLTSAADGPLRLDVIRAVVAAVHSPRLVSATAGDLPMDPDALSTRVQELAATEVDYINVVIPSGIDALPCITSLTRLGSQTKLIAVFRASAPPDLASLSLLSHGNFAGATIDMRIEVDGGLLNRFGMSYLRGFIERCHASGLIAGLAGSLEMPDIPRLIMLAPDLLGFRNTLRSSGRQTGELDLTRIAAIRGLIPPEVPDSTTQKVDYRLLGSHFNAPLGGEDVPVDLVLVEALVLPVFIGAYDWERDTPQKVRFAVTASVMRMDRHAEDMRDVFSYDLITDGIRMLVDSGHVALIETLAERIATLVLDHPRVVKVVVRVQKLETQSGTVGVEIERNRAAVRSTGRPIMPLMAKAQGGTTGVDGTS